jgi:hypothetical protein
MDFQPSLDAARKFFVEVGLSKISQPTLLPLYISTPSDLLTPSAIFLKLAVFPLTCTPPLRAHLRQAKFDQLQGLISSPPLNRII